MSSLKRMAGKTTDSVMFTKTTNRLCSKLAHLPHRPNLKTIKANDRCARKAMFCILHAHAKHQFRGGGTRIAATFSARLSMAAPISSVAFRNSFTASITLTMVSVTLVAISII
jgi:hypothetical protein